MNLTKILGVVSALALMVALTAYTEANATSATTTTSVTATKETPILSGIQADMKQNWEKLKGDVKDAADNTKQNFQARVINDTSANSTMTINQRATATAMLGQPVNDMSGKKIATLKDIILDSTGKAVMVVVSDGGFMGVGDKLAAFDASLVIQQNADGDVVMPISEETLKKVAAFSYQPTDASATVHVMPANGYSVAELLKGKLIDPAGQSLGNIENITFAGGEASQVIVAFDQKLGLGGDRAALDFDDLTLSKQADGTLDFRMNTRQSAQFEAYKAIKTN